MGCRACERTGDPRISKAKPLNRPTRVGSSLCVQFLLWVKARKARPTCHRPRGAKKGAWSSTRSADSLDTGAPKEHPTRGQIKVGWLLKGDEPDWTLAYTSLGGAISDRVRKLRGIESAVHLANVFNQIVVVDGLAAARVDEAFWRI